MDTSILGTGTEGRPPTAPSARSDRLVAVADAHAGTARAPAQGRLATLRRLGTLSTSECSGPAAASRAVLDVLSANRADIPFAAAYLCSDDGRRSDGTPELVASYGYRPASGGGGGPQPDELPVLSEVLASGAGTVLEELARRVAGSFEGAEASGFEPPRTAVLQPITRSGSAEPVGVLALAVSPHRELDADYRTFLDLVAARASVAVADALAHAAERRRAEALAELDAAKTRFIQNISHELRTPLTLVLGPLGELLHDPDVHLPPARRDGLLAAQRAAHRLARLVDGLLDVARAEADRLHADLEPTRLGELTTDVASMFRSPAEHGGLELVVEIAEDVDTQPVLVDQELWARIVLNLLSNALEFTEQGRVTLTLRTTDETVELAVQDTGTGIAAEETPRVFDRFHQVPGLAGRSREGAGLGLSLVREGARAHGGSARVDSTPGEGSTFTVTLPRRTAPDRAPRTAAPPTELTACTAAAAVRAGSPATSTPHAASTGTVLLVEDNADMRGFVTRLREGDGWRVESAPDVDTALGLLGDLRGDPNTASIPVVLLTARAGSDSTAAGLAHGADDYVVKPFDPAELLARVRTHVELARLRNRGRDEAEREAANLRQALESNRRIGTAIGILMNQRKIPSEAAFDLLRETSQHLNRKLRDVADEVVWTGALPEAAGRRSTHRARRP